MSSASGRFALPEKTFRPRRLFWASVGSGFSAVLLLAATRASGFSRILGPMGSSGLVHLAGARDRERLVGDVLRHGRAGGDLGAPAHLHGRDQVDVGADEGLRGDRRLVLLLAVVVAGDRARADVDVLGDLGVADVGEVVDLRTE